MYSIITGIKLNKREFIILFINELTDAINIELNNHYHNTSLYPIVCDFIQNILFNFTCHDYIKFYLLKHERKNHTMFSLDEYQNYQRKINKYFNNEDEHFSHIYKTVESYLNYSFYTLFT